MRTFRIFVSTVVFLALVAFAYSRGGAAAADSMSDKWLSPAPSAAKKNPIEPTQHSIAAGQKIYSKSCLLCHGTSGDADGPAVIELNIHPARLSDPQLNTEPDVHKLTEPVAFGATDVDLITGTGPLPTSLNRRLTPQPIPITLHRSWLLTTTHAVLTPPHLTFLAHRSPAMAVSLSRV